MNGRPAAPITLRAVLQQRLLRIQKTEVVE